MANGIHSVTAVARDAAGNVTTSAPVSITVSNAAPRRVWWRRSGLMRCRGRRWWIVGFGNNGTVSGATRSTAGRYGGALSFDGVNDSVSVPDAASLDLTNNMTLSAWVRPTGATGWRTVLMKERPGGSVLQLVRVGWGAGARRAQLVIGAAEQAAVVTVGVAGQRLVASGLDLRRGGHAAVRQRGRGRQPAPDRQHRGVAPGR